MEKKVSGVHPPGKVIRALRLMLPWGILIILSLPLAGQAGDGAEARGAEIVTLSGYDQVYDFGSFSGVRWNTGDEPAYRQPGYDDSAWTTVTLPHQWDSHDEQSTTAWYRFWFLPPQGPQTASIYLELGRIADFDTIYLNGHRVGENGGFQDPGADELYDVVRRYELPPAFLKPGEPNLIALEVSSGNHSRGGLLTGPFTFGPLRRFGRTTSPADIIQIALTSMYLLTGFFFLLLFFKNPKELSVLVFGLFTLAITVYFFHNYDVKFLLYQSHYNLMRRLQFASLWASFPLFMVFILTYFSAPLNKLHLGYLGVSGLTVLTAFLIPDVHYLNWVNLRFVQITWLVPIVVILRTIRQNWYSSPDTRPLIRIFLITVPFIVFDILKAQEITLLQPLPYLSAYGFAVFILGSAIIVLHRFARLELEVHRLGHLARVDQLTGTFQRSHFLEQLERSLAGAVSLKQPLSLLLIDLDHFKHTNDSLGHQAGDQVLQELGAIFQSMIRTQDAVGRIGGEEFLIMLPSTPLEGGRLLAERLRARVEASPVLWQEQSIPITISIGVSGYPGCGSTPRQLIGAADRAMYQAKQQGRNRIIVAECGDDRLH
ncbi:GGDEF domain-containing protein [Spirochaeta lutea]|uniref:GGDEF domain-containing protein n=1 Tax=Spirochaeta lutea TaxID=1480694 RepID=UPI000690763E|nr:diguanylate cyclase [Spirochaeta lutea]